MDGFDEIRIVFDAPRPAPTAPTRRPSAPHGKQLVDLTPAAIGPYTVPAVNLARISTRAT